MKRLFVWSFLGLLFLPACDYEEIYGEVDDSTWIANMETPVMDCKGINASEGRYYISAVRMDDGRCYPEGIFVSPTLADECEETHYHYDLLSLDGTVRENDHDSPCGSAVESDKKATGYAKISQEMFDAWNEKWPQLTGNPFQMEAEELEESE